MPGSLGSSGRDTVEPSVGQPQQLRQLLPRDPGDDADADARRERLERHRVVLLYRVCEIRVQPRHFQGY